MKQNGVRLLRSRVYFVGALPFLAMVCLATLSISCAAPPPSSPERHTVENNPALHESARMLLATRPFKSIYLEVDAVAGAEVPSKTVDALAEFLRQACRKPVTVVIKEPIRASEVVGMPPQVIALFHMSGPPATDTKEAPAFIYVLLYSKPWSREGGHTNSGYPCAIFINADWLPTILSRQAAIRLAMKHEAGHMMTLGSNSAHGDGNHCGNSGCLMVARWGGEDLCQACRQDLEELRRSVQPAKMTFKGPFLVRRENGYFVAMLPSAVHMEVGDGDEWDWQNALGDLRNEVRALKENRPEDFDQLSNPRAAYRCAKWHCETKEEWLRQRKAVLAAMSDADPQVRDLAQTMKAAMDKRFGLSATSQGNR